MKYPIILGHRSKDTLKAEAYHKNASYFLLGELRIFILYNTGWCDSDWLEEKT